MSASNEQPPPEDAQPDTQPDGASLSGEAAEHASEGAHETALDPPADPQPYDDYGADKIEVLEGLDAVRKRPGMYIGSTGLKGLHHLVWEVVDNAVDEAMVGHCTRIDVTLLADGGCEVVDNGRGIPVGIKEGFTHPDYGALSAAELVFTVLHAGGKFNGDGYTMTGGLHGVGVSVVNALSSKVEVEIDRAGRRHAMTFAQGGKIAERLREVGAAPIADNGAIGESPASGTTVRFWPDPEIFDETEFRYQTLLDRFQQMAFLNKDLEIRVRDLRPDDPEDQAWTSYRYSGGIVDFVRHLNASKEALFAEVGYFEGDAKIDHNRHEAEVAFQWNKGYSDGIHSFANGIATSEGGTHDEGFRAALTRTVNAYAKTKGLLNGSAKLDAKDIREGLSAVISVRIAEPQFEGQTKSKLGNESMRSHVQKVTNKLLAEWLEEHPAEAKAAVAKSLAASKARMAAEATKAAIRSKSLLDGAGMPDKLKDCSSADSSRRELFIVEGDSAGGSAVRARDPETQAILPIRGKILNVERARVDRMLRNTEIQSLVTAIGAGIADDFDVVKARYRKVIVLADADVDGSHIATLLLTFFFRQMRPLVEAGYVYIAQPPLYSTKLSARQTVYLKDDSAKDAFMAEHPKHKGDFNRLKGLGEMDWEELRTTTMAQDSRRLLQVSVVQPAIADEITAILMGDEVEPRKQFIVTNAREVRNLDF